MKLNRVLAPFCGALVLVGGISVAHSQEVAPVPQLAQPLVAPGALERKSAHPIRIKNVAARLIAFWLDPANNPQPSYWQATRGDAKVFDQPQFQGAPGTSKTALGAFKLPAGIDQIVAIDPQNAILVFGTDAGVRELQETINFLDRPLRQVEIETQWVQVSDEDAKAFGIGVGAPPAGKVIIGRVSGNFQDTLIKLINSKKAKVVAAPRVTLIDNFSGRLTTAPISSAALGFQGDDGKFHGLSDSATPQNAGQLRVTTSFEVEVTPSINNDHTVTTLMSFKQLLQLSSAEQEPRTARTSGVITSIVNARDGETVALRGLSALSLPGLGRGKKAGASPILLFVTARVLRRMSDEVVDAN